MLPDFVIIGAQKSASTFVHECLAEHPEVYLPHEETAIFEDHRYQPDDLSPLERLFEVPEAREAKRRGIKRPNYLGIENVPERIARHLPEARLIAVLRHPVDRLVSAWFHYIRGGFAPALELNEGVQKLLAGELREAYPRTEELLTFGRYDEHLERYFSHFSPEQIFVCLHEDIVKAPLDSIERIYRFLGVDVAFKPETSMGKKPKESIYSLPRLKFLRTLYRATTIDTAPGRLRHRPLSFKEAPLRTTLRHSGVAVDSLLLKHLLKSPKPALRPDLREALLDYYRPSIETLQNRYQLELSHWK